MNITFKTKDERLAYIQGMIDAKELIVKNSNKTIFLDELLLYLSNKITNLQCEVAEKDYGFDLRSVYNSLKNCSAEEIKELKKQFDYTINFFSKEEVGD